MQKLKLDHNFKSSHQSGLGRIRELRRRAPTTPEALSASSYRFRLIGALLVAVVVVSVLATTAARSM